MSPLCKFCISIALLLLSFPAHSMSLLCNPIQMSSFYEAPVIAGRVKTNVAFGRSLQNTHHYEYARKKVPKMHESSNTAKTNHFRQSIIPALSGITQGTTLALRQSWWCFPMLLILVPFICILNGSCAQMPSWWAMSNLKYLQSTKVGTLICIGFLSSNVFYFLSGLYLLNKKPLRRNMDRRRSVVDTNGFDPMLGWLTLCCGGMSLIYHSFQAVGPINVAQSLCFVDHGLAISSACCFLDRCGFPSVKTWIIGLLSLSLLVISGDVYPIVHSLWHLGSAGASISWAADGVERRRKFIAESLKQRRSSFESY